MEKRKLSSSVQFTDFSLEQIEFLKKATGLNRNQIIERAIDRMAKGIIEEQQIYNAPIAIVRPIKDSNTDS